MRLLRGFFPDLKIRVVNVVDLMTKIDRFHLALDVIARLPRLAQAGAAATRFLLERLAAHHAHVRATGTTCPKSGTGADRKVPGAYAPADQL